VPPNNLAVYLSNRCNLACRYCYVAVNQGEARYLAKLSRRTHQVVIR